MHMYVNEEKTVMKKVLIGRVAHKVVLVLVPLVIYLYVFITTVRGQVLELPEPSINLTCISYNFENLVCSAVIPFQSTNVPMNWSMQFKRQSDEKSFPGNCMRAEVEINCSLPVGQFRHFQNFSITIQGINNELNVNLSELFVVTTNYIIVKPNPVSSFECTTNSSTSVECSWKAPVGLPKLKLQYRLEIISQYSPDVRTLYYNDSVKGSYIVQNLIPYVHYSAAVYARIIDYKSQSYWSDEARKNFTTLEDVPGMPVILTPGSFITYNCSELNMCLVLYWKNPPRQSWHGVISYEISLSQGSDTIIVTNISDSVYYNLCLTFNTSDLLTISDPYHVTMKLVTSVGSGVDNAELLVPSMQTDHAIKPVWVVVEIDVNHVLLSWQVAREVCANITSATYYWCLERYSNSSIFVTCQDDLDWFTVNVTDGCNQSTQIWLNRTGDQSNIKFAVSVAVDNISNGMMLERYRFQMFHAVPVKPLYRVVSPSPSQLQITVLFGASDIRYISSGGRPQSYQILYDKHTARTQKCTEEYNKRLFPASFSNPVITLDNLSPNTTYIVCVIALNSAGFGPMGDPLVSVTRITKDSSKLAISVYIAVTVTVVVLLAILAIFCSYNKVRKKFQDFWTINMTDVDINLDQEYGKIMHDNTLTENAYSVFKNANTVITSTPFIDSGKAPSTSSSIDIDERTNQESDASNNDNCRYYNDSLLSSPSFLSGYLKNGQACQACVYCSASVTDEENELVMIVQPDQSTKIANDGTKMAPVRKYCRIDCDQSHHHCYENINISHIVKASSGQNVSHTNAPANVTANMDSREKDEDDKINPIDKFISCSITPSCASGSVVTDRHTIESNYYGTDTSIISSKEMVNCVQECKSLPCASIVDSSEDIDQWGYKTFDALADDFNSQSESQFQMDEHIDDGASDESALIDSSGMENYQTVDGMENYQTVDDICLRQDSLPLSESSTLSEGIGTLDRNTSVLNLDNVTSEFDESKRTSCVIKDIKDACTKRDHDQISYEVINSNLDNTSEFSADQTNSTECSVESYSKTHILSGSSLDGHELLIGSSHESTVKVADIDLKPHDKYSVDHVHRQHIVL